MDHNLLYFVKVITYSMINIKWLIRLLNYKKYVDNMANKI